MSGQLALPWVRLHGVKNYLRMAETLQDFPKIHATINVVPSLALQLSEYAQGQAEDRCLALTRRNEWTSEEKAFLLSFFFHVNWERTVRKIPRYWQLLQIRQLAKDDPDLLSADYYRDLTVWWTIWI